MKQFVKAAVLFALLAVIAAPVSAQDQQAKKKRRQANQRVQAVTMMMKKLEKAELKADQKEKIKKIVAEHKPKLAEAAKKVNAFVTKDKRKEVTAATKKAREAGKKQAEIQAIVVKTLGLSEADAKKRAEALKARQAAQGAFRAAIVAVLSPEQQQKAGLKQRRARRKKNADK